MCVHHFLTLTRLHGSKMLALRCCVFLRGVLRHVGGTVRVRVKARDKTEAKMLL